MLTDKKISISGVPKLTDTFFFLELLSSFGVEVKGLDNFKNTKKFILNAKKITNNKAPYNLVKKMRASILVLGPLLARFKKAKISLPGGCSIGTRPIDIHLKALSKLGAIINIENGFVNAEDIYIPPSENPDDVQVLIDSNSERLQKLEPFDAWNGQDLNDLRVMIKAKGKCTTDHISPAGPWLSLRGHLDKLSDNLLLGAVNAFNDQVGKAKNMLTSKIENCAQIGREYKKQNISWIIVGDENYGEGSSREHAAMTPRYLGCVAVIAKSFARIHETNLKKQGVLALTFDNPEDYDKIHEDDLISVNQLNEISTGKPVECNILHTNETSEKIILNHSFNDLQIEWFKAGSAMNVLRKK